MPPSVPRSEPSNLTAGNTWTWNRYFPLYQTTDSPAWTITYYLQGGAVLNFAAGIDPENANMWLVSQPPAFSANVPDGTYQWVAKATRVVSTVPQQYDAGAGVFTIVPNYILVEARVSHNERMLRQITAVLEDRAGADVQEYTIGGRRMVKIPIMELIGLQSIYQSRVAQDRRPGRTGVAVKVVFGPGGGTIPYDGLRRGAGFNVDSY